MPIKSTNFKPDNSLAILLASPPKTGKTGVIFAFPDLYILDCDMNLAGEMRRFPTKQFDFDQPAHDADKNIERPVVDRWNFAVKCLKEAIANPAYKTIAVDGLGLLVEWLCEHLINEFKKAGNCKTGRMELQMYPELARLLKGLVIMLRTSGKIVLFSSHQSADKDEATGIMRYNLAIPGQCKETLGGLFTDVWAMSAKSIGGKVSYEIKTKPTGLNVDLGTSFALPPSLDVTDKTPDQIWTILKPYLGR